MTDTVAATPWYRTLSIQLIAVFTAALACATAVNIWMTGRSFRGLQEAVAQASQDGVGAVKAQVSQELEQSGQAVIEHAARELFYRQLAYLRENPRSRNIKDARKLADFCIHDEGYQRLVLRKFMQYGYTNAAVAVGPKIVVVAHPRKDIVGEDFYKANADLTPDERRLQRSDEFAEYWKDRRSAGLYYQQAAAFRPEGIPADMTQKYMFEVWGDFNGIQMYAEVNTYIDEFRHSIRQIEDRQQQTVTRIDDATRSAARRYARQSLTLSLVLLVVIVAAVRALTRRLVDELSETAAALRREKEQSESLLLSVLPRKIAERLKGRPAGIMVEDFAQVSVLFTDFKDFTRVAGSVTPDRLIRELNEIFGRFDELAERHHMEKIKTIGDSYFAVGGLPERNSTHPADAVRLALAMRDCVEARAQEPDALGLRVRIGVHSGPVIAGIIGRTRFSYDLWGDTVNIASRMESSGEPGKVNISEATYALVKDLFVFTPRGKVPAKGKGEFEMYFVESDKDDAQPRL